MLANLKLKLVIPTQLSAILNSWQQGVGLLGLLCLIIMTWLPKSYFRMVGWPWIAVWQLGFILIVVSTISMLRQFKQPFHRLGYGLDWIVGIFLVVLALSSGFSQFPVVAAWNVYLILGYVVCIFMLRNWLKEQALTRQHLWSLLSAIGAITSLISLAYWRPDADMWLSDNFKDAIRNPMPLGHHNFTGGYLVLVIPIIASYALGQNNRKRWLWSLATLLSVIALYTSGSRGAWLGMGITVLVALGITLWRSRGKQRQRAVMLTLVSLVLLGGLFFSNPRIRNLALDAPKIFTPQQQTNVTSIGDGPAKDRFFMAQAAINIIQDRPLLGVGPGNMSRVYNLYRPIEAGTGLDLVQQLHNMPLQILGELGLLGFIVYGVLWIRLIGIWLRLNTQIKEAADRQLLYGIGASLLGYSVSSLTDSQLENVAISSTLLILLLLMISLADSYLPPELVPSQDLAQNLAVRRNNLPRSTRRLASLCLLVYIAIASRLWLPADAALAFSSQAVKAIHSGDLIAADRKWHQAASLAFWDPTYHNLIAQQLLDIRKTIKNDPDREALIQEAIDQHKAALESAPNDPAINTNLAVLYSVNDLENAKDYAQRAIRLLPRSFNRNYYLLGLLYKQQNKDPMAFTALSLEALSNPRFITARTWWEPPLDVLRPVAMQTILEHYELLLDSLPIDHPEYDVVYEYILLTRWWHALPLPDEIELTRLGEMSQLILLADRAPDFTLEQINNLLDQDPARDNLKLFRAWLAPDQYLNPYIESAQLTKEEAALAKSYIRENRQLRAWMRSVYQEPIDNERGSLTFAYRNLEANRINLILRPPNSEESVLAQTFGLFNPMPREFPELDELMEQIRADVLGLSHPTRNHFQL